MSNNNTELFLSPEELRMYKIKKACANSLVYVFLTIIALFIVIPFYYMLLTSVQTPGEIESDALQLFPKAWAWENYLAIFGTGERGYSIWTMYGSTIFVAVITTIGTVVTVVFSAFVLLSKTLYPYKLPAVNE